MHFISYLFINSTDEKSNSIMTGDKRERQHSKINRFFYRTFSFLHFSTELFSILWNENRSVVFQRSVFRFRRVMKVSFSFDKTT